MKLICGITAVEEKGELAKGVKVYLGGYDKEEKAARAYDMVVLKYWGSNATTNFPIYVYTNKIEEMKHMTKQECIASLKRYWNNIRVNVQTFKTSYISASWCYCL